MITERLHRATPSTIATRGVVPWRAAPSYWTFVHLSPGARPDLQHVLSMPGFRSQTAYIFAVSNVARSRRHWIRLVRRSMTPCVRAAAVYALSVTVARVANSRVFRGLHPSSGHRESDASRACRLATRSTRSQRSTLIKWIARVSLSSRKTRVQRSSRHPRTPRTPRRERPPRRPMVCRVGGFGSASGFLDIISQSSTNRPSPLHLRQTHLHHTSCHRLHDLAHRHRPP